ncbi:RNA polymerase subunit sigma [Streptomyces longwoodensis]|uniref:RNA polymerase subunit sigma n=1 Tax=Streptomyces longwoodensis TaxID=68231 RepID=UPI00384E045E
MDQPGDAVPIAELLDERRHLMDVACWMLGRGREAEDVVAETYRRWYALSEPERTRITDPRSWLSKTAGTICLARLALPGRRHTDGPANGRGPAGLQGGLEDEVSQVLLDALDTLSPAERAAFVLNDVFGMAPSNVSDVVGQSERECAELAERARHSLRARRARPTPVWQHDLVVHAVREACTLEDGARLASLLASDVTAFYDGGGKVRALARPVHGDRQVAGSLLTLLARRPHTSIHLHSVNGRTGLLVHYDGQVAAVISLDIAGPQVVQVWVVLNPDKLRLWNRTGPGPDVTGAQDDVRK